MDMKTNKLKQQYESIAEYFNRPVSAVFMKKAGFHNKYARKEEALKITTAKMRIAQKYMAIFFLLPFVKMIGISGSVGAYTPQKDDDIDIVFVVRKNSLWLTRFLDFVILNALGVRRHRNPKTCKNMLCINLYLSYENLQLPSHDIYTAFQLINIIPIFGKRTYHTLLSANKFWLQKFIISKDIFSCDLNVYSRFVNTCKDALYYITYPFTLLINCGLKIIQTIKLKTHDPNEWSYSDNHISTYRQNVRQNVLDYINSRHRENN